MQNVENISLSFEVPEEDAKERLEDLGITG
jgi:hypothetical protein